jgi:hypothetical protein
MTPPWYPAFGASSGGAGTGACCCVGSRGMNLPGAAFCKPTTGCDADVGRTATATATASVANAMTAKATTALPTSTDPRLSLARSSPGSPSPS